MPKLDNINCLLVANRGEIAIRIMRAASELGIETIAIYTFEDRYSLHRYKADRSYQIGDDKDPLKPYLNIEEIIKVAKEKGADAIHPGYGFLSENVQFARRCREEGIRFVGPSPEAMEALGDKVRAKEIAKKANVPIILDNEQPLTSLDVALEEASRISYPIMVKAAAGGGGRGMRVVRNDEDLTKAFSEAKREAGNAFGDDTIFLEKFIEEPKHIEVQLLGDQHGNLVHLFERDCSVQRRFQKVVEVAPAPSLQQITKDKLYEYALAIGKTVDYSNAGTVEFLVDKNENIFFIEVNPRIQVEHTVTEEITGIDIVRSQILIADGKELTDNQIYILNQDQISCNGFAVQCRITTEDPQSGFKPDYGRIVAYRNAGGYGIRLDEGSSYAGVEISPFFDSMIVKVTASGRTLQGATQRLHRTLSEYRIRGVKTNIPFLQNVITHPKFRSGDYTVSFVETAPELFKYPRKKDSGTKLLRYLGNTIINGNPDVKGKVSKEAVFREATIPEYGKTLEYSSGTKNKLTELGPEKFAQWLKQEKQIHYTDTTFRDAHQSLLATRFRTKDMLAVAEGMAKANPNIFSFECWGGATFDVAMRFLKECPWERLRMFREAIPNQLLQMLIRGSNGVGYTAYPDNLVENFIEESWKTGIDVFRIFDSLNWLENMETSIKTVRERTGGLAEVCICYTGDFKSNPTGKYSLQYYLDLARRIEDSGAHIIAIKDMAGLLKPYTATELVTELKKAVDLPIHLHTHDTSSIQNSTYMKAIEAGVDVVDVALASMSGLTSQPNFNSLVAVMEGSERNQPMNLKALNEYSNYFEAVREWYYPFESGLKAGSAEVFEHEIPGGQYSNLRPQARGLGLEDKFETIKENYKKANDLFGDIVKVTPSSKVVGDMAMFMTSNGYSIEDIKAKGESISFPDSVKALMRGDLGQTPGGFPSDIQKLVLKDEQPYTDKPNAHLNPINIEQEFLDFQDQFDEYCNFRDFLSYKFYPAVFKDFHKHHDAYGDVSVLPSLPFFYGLKPDEEILVELTEGKNILIKYMYSTEPDEKGEQMVYFKLNGQTRGILVQNTEAAATVKSNKKAEADHQVGAPLQGKLSQVLVKVGDKVKKNTPLAILEAMKMESTITAPFDGEVSHVELTGGDLVEGGDLILELK